jgi:hypothetical protein
MTEPTVIYDDVEVLRNDGLGLLCRIHGKQPFVGMALVMPGSLAAVGIHQHLVLPEWFAVEAGLPLPPTAH